MPAHNSIAAHGGIISYLNSLYANGKVKVNGATYDSWMRDEPRPPQMWRARKVGVSITAMKRYDKQWESEYVKH